MIVITGAAGFIASVVAGCLNEQGRNDLVLVDDFSKKQKERNYINKKYQLLLDRKEFHNWLKLNHDKVDFIVHLGARTDTTEFDWNVFVELNVNYTEQLWTLCTEYQIPLVYASSAATYGGGELGYVDSHDIVEKLQPLNPYGRSKNEIDKWILKQTKCPPFWAGLKFFNVYGPNEYHKGRMASVILHSFHQIQECGEVKLFRSHRPDFKDGQQLRDFIYVKDIASVILFLIEKRPESGLYNLGTGHARSFYDLASNTFKAMGKEVNIKFIDTPLDIRDKYQYFTEANMEKLRKAGYNKPFTSLEDGVFDYVQNYLMKDKTF
ncbi:MAG: ADP-glyceromanno-heptose 6-epimerase [Bacteroidales bacterium]|nr:ADP-glyceromanno-heptose 6-epimerase [Bacteroidales bacterium]